MEYALLGFFTGLSLILALGAQNIFVIEQGLKKQYVFLICLICSLSDLILIFLGIFLFHYFNQYFNQTVELIFNILLIIFLLHFIYTKIKIRSEIEQTKQIRNTYCFFNPCSITNIFWAPIAKIRLKPVKKPNNRNSIRFY